MATSGSYDFLLTLDNIITLACQHVQLVGEGGTPSANLVTEAAYLLNMIMKLRAADGMPLWALKRGYILPFSGASSINTDSHVTTFYDYTTLSADASSGATTITVDAAGTIANSDQIGIELSSGDMHWTTVSSGGGTTTLVLASGLSAAASDGGAVYAYTASADRIQKPLRILEANTLDVANGVSTELRVEDRADYFNLGNRTTEGVPNLIYYTPESSSTTNLDNGKIFVYPRFSTGDYIIEFTYHRPLQDFDSSTDNPDCPQAFYLPLMLELAALLGPKAGVPIEERRALFGEAKMYREEALATIAPEGSLSLQPETSW